MPGPNSPTIDSVNNEGQSSEFRLLATRLSQRLERLEAHLNTPDGQVKVEVQREFPTEGSTLALRTHRDGDKWIFQYREILLPDPTDLSARFLSSHRHADGWAPLKSASVMTKVQAVGLMPDLFTALAQRHNAIVDELRNAHRQLDLIEQEHVTPKKGGK